MRQIILLLILIILTNPISSQDIEIFNMPVFPGCNYGTEQEKQNCSHTKFETYISDHLVYPKLALTNGIDGIVIVTFIISKDSIIKDIEVVRDLGYGCGEEASKLILEMNNFKEKWIPAKQRGKDVDIKYTYPVRFKRSLIKNKKKKR